MNIKLLDKLTRLIRYYILTMTTTAGSGHTTSSLSAVELMTVLFFGGFFRADLDSPQNPGNDRLIFSKGHASPLFYSLYAAAGKLTMDDLLKYRKFDSPLEGHPTLEFPYTEAPTGSLGQGLSVGLGMALAIRHRMVEGSVPRVFVLLGDGETAEGSVWEAIEVASYHKVDNLVAILDVNRLGQSQPTMLEHNLNAYKKRFDAFGWKTIVVKNGHDLKQVSKSFKDTKMQSGKGKPVVIIAKTFKGYGIKALQDVDGWHGKPPPKDLYEKAIKELGKVDLKVRGEVEKPITNYQLQITNKIQNPKSKINYKLGDAVATRQAAGDALTSLMSAYNNVVVLDGDVKNSLFTETTQKAHPQRYFEMFIAEQNMVGAATGMSRRGFIPFVTTFAAFMTRAFDQIRMAALGHANIKFIGSHAGVSIGEDGASQMGLEDLAMFRAVFDSTVLYPADAVSAQKLVEEMIKRKGICYLRVARPTTAVIYDEKEEFPIGGCKTHSLSPKLLKSPRLLKQKVILIAAGVTLYEALAAQQELAREGIEAVVVDCYCLKPIDAKTLISLVTDVIPSDPPAGGEPRDLSRMRAGDTNYQLPITNIITVEDHWSEGGLGDAVLNVFSGDYYQVRQANPNQVRNLRVKVHKMAVTKMPHSGKPAELMDYEGISAKAIVAKAKTILFL